MRSTEYKNKFNDEHYDRIYLAVPKGMKEVFKRLASDKGMSLNAYIIDLVRQDQMGMFDAMQIAEKNKEQIRSLSGNQHDGYDIVFKDGHNIHCRTKLETRKAIISYLAQDSENLTQDT